MVLVLPLAIVAQYYKLCTEHFYILISLDSTLPSLHRIHSCISVTSLATLIEFFSSVDYMIKLMHICNKL